MYARMGDLASKVTAALGGSTDNITTTPTTTTAVLYRVRKSWADSKSQKGAYKVLTNAKKCADANPGYNVFDASGTKVYPAASADTTYTVVHGDTLWGIAQKLLGSGSRYKEIVELNGLKSSVIYAGQKLKIPQK